MTWDTHVANLLPVQSIHMYTNGVPIYLISTQGSTALTTVSMLFLIEAHLHCCKDERQAEECTLTEKDCVENKY